VAETTVAEFKNLFDRYFTFSENLPDIRDKDIERAFDEADSVFNVGIYPSDSSRQLAYSYLAAHFLQADLDASEAGGQTSLLQSSRSADGISESLAIPKRMVDDQDFAFYFTTYYGQKWLALTAPFLDGAVFAVSGRTTP
jgi:hypothetical protein